MRESTLRAEVWVPHPPEAIFPFFSDPRNLQAITPPWLRFEVLTPLQEMKQRTMIDYRLRVHGFWFNWSSEITMWEPPIRFIDEQRRGPYRLWIHEHVFEPCRQGTLCKDFVRYAAPGGWLVERLFVRRDVERIFAFRQQKLQEMFGG